MSIEQSRYLPRVVTVFTEVEFDGAIPARLCNVVGMVFAGAFLKSFYAACERRVRNLYLCWFDFTRRSWRRDFYFLRPHVSPVVVRDVESHEAALSSDRLAVVTNWPMSVKASAKKITVATRSR
jgi:ABC-type amino acid transport substrate-binding protein